MIREITTATATEGLTSVEIHRDGTLTLTNNHGDRGWSLYLKSLDDAREIIQVLLEITSWHERRNTKAAP